MDFSLKLKGDGSKVSGGFCHYRLPPGTACEKDIIKGVIKKITVQECSPSIIAISSAEILSFS
jgi:hypothetical protein